MYIAYILHMSPPCWLPLHYGVVVCGYGLGMRLS